MCIAAICSSILIFNFMGCRNYEKEEKDALAYLSNKYGEEFELEGNFVREGNNEFNPSPIKSTSAWPKGNSDNIFTIKLNPEDEFRDNYQNILMKSLADEYLVNMVRSYWSNGEIYVELSGGLTNKKFQEDNISAFLVDSGVVSDIYMFFQYNNDFDINEEGEKIYKLYKEFEGRELEGHVKVMYVMKDILEKEKINNKTWSNLEANKSYIKKCSIRYSKSYPEGNDEITIESIKQKLEKNYMEDN